MRFRLAEIRAFAGFLARMPGRTSSQRTPRTLAARTTYKVHGIEIFPGIGTPFSRTTRYGATFVGVERGVAPTTLVGWINYTPIFFKPDTECTVVGGRWLLVAGEGLRYRYMLYGSFNEGVVRWNRAAKLAEALVRLKVTGGTRAYRNSLSGGDLAAALNHLPFPPFPPRIGGTLRLAQHVW